MGEEAGGWLEGGQVGTHLSCFSQAGGDERGTAWLLSARPGRRKRGLGDRSQL